MPRRRTTTIVVTSIAALVVGAVGAGAWSVMNSMNGSISLTAATPTNVPTTASTPVDEEEAAKLAAERVAKGLAVGAVLTADQAKTISHYWQGNLLPYRMADGSQVLIARDQPLPENVKVDAGRKLTAAAQAGAARESYNEEIITASKTVAYEVGHTVKTITYLNTYVGPDYEHRGWTWMNGVDGQQYDSPDAAIAALGPVPAGVEIIVSQ